MNVYTRRRAVLVVLLFIITQVCVVVDRRAPVFMLMGFFLMGMVVLSIHAYRMVRTSRKAY